MVVTEYACLTAIGNMVHNIGTSLPFASAAGRGADPSGAAPACFSELGSYEKEGK